MNTEDDEFNRIERESAMRMASVKAAVEKLQPCVSPYCECTPGKCSHPGYYDARHETHRWPKHLQPAQPELAPIYYMRDNHTFKKLSAAVSTALVEIEHEFNEGYTYGALCSKREGFQDVHASGSKKRLEFFAECKTTLEKWLPTSPPASKPWVGLTDADIKAILDNDFGGSRADCMRAAEAKLKEKNT